MVRDTPPLRRVCNLAERLLKWSSSSHVYELNNSRNVERIFLELDIEEFGLIKLADSYLR